MGAVTCFFVILGLANIFWFRFGIVAAAATTSSSAAHHTP
jgi:hypothetical protein